MIEALTCNPLGGYNSRSDAGLLADQAFPRDTIKVRMQLSSRNRCSIEVSRGFVKTTLTIIQDETVVGLYRRLGVVLRGIIPKMVIRFSNFEAYKQLLADQGAA